MFECKNVSFCGVYLFAIRCISYCQNVDSIFLLQNGVLLTDLTICVAVPQGLLGGYFGLAPHCAAWMSPTLPGPTVASNSIGRCAIGHRVAQVTAGFSHSAFDLATPRRSIGCPWTACLPNMKGLPLSSAVVSVML